MPFNSLPQASSSANTSLLSKVGLLFSIDMIAGAYGAYCGQGITSGWAVLGLFAASIVMLFVIKGLEQANTVLAAIAATGFSWLIGLMVAPAIVMHAHNIGWSAVALAFLGTSLAMVLFGA
ncbi:MAG: hypothetical protein ACRD3J_27285, partial [Thermoanaerobaculia bacterium]